MKTLLVGSWGLFGSNDIKRNVKISGRGGLEVELKIDNFLLSTSAGSNLT